MYEHLKIIQPKMMMIYTSQGDDHSNCHNQHSNTARTTPFLERLQDFYVMYCAVPVAGETRVYHFV
jgi:hypothetical protein